MRDWSNLPREHLILIADLLTLRHDLGSFRCVCNRWRHAIADEVFINKQVLTEPSLMLASKQKDQRKFYVPSKDLIYNRVELPSFTYKYCLSSRGCLVMHTKNLYISLVNPVTGVTIGLPRMTTISNWKTEFLSTPLYNVRKVAFSSNPFKSPSQDCKLMIIYGHMGKLAFCRLSDSAWTFVDVEDDGCIFDIIWYNERFYAINTERTIFSVDIDEENVVQITRMSFLKRQRLPRSPDEWYLIDFKRILLAVAQYNASEYKPKRGVVAACLRFKAFAVDIGTGKVSEIRDIGEGALFLGYNSSEYVKASKSVRPNSIYFNDHMTYRWNGKKRSVLDISVFNFENGIVEPYLKREFYNYHASPIWIIPTD